MRSQHLLKSRNKTLQLGLRTCIMGVVNITPDSFYDGGAHFKPEDAIAHGNRLLEEGADILDLGGQSTRPASEPVGAQEELRRVLPVLKSLRQHKDIWLSIDTYRSEVAKVCLDEGADMINDVSSFRMDPNLPSILAQFKVPVVCMHFLKSIHPMPSDPQYKDLKTEIVEFFEETFRITDNAGIDRDQLILDPGIGFGKKLEHNLEIIRDLSFLHELKRPILAGPSRKSFIQKITGLPAESRLEGTVAAAAMCLMQGAHILRVHDVRFFRRFCDVFDVLLHS
jgi:dihydropteroate synthase